MPPRTRVAGLVDSSTEKDNRSSIFFSLPLEVREVIYEELLQFERPISFEEDKSEKWRALAQKAALDEAKIIPKNVKEEPFYKLPMKTMVILECSHPGYPRPTWVRGKYLSGKHNRVKRPHQPPLEFCKYCKQF